MSSIVDRIIDITTNQLINLANIIVEQCQGDNCNTSFRVQSRIFRSLSLLSQEQGKDINNRLGLNISSNSGNLIYENYINLGSTIANVYNYQCGSTTSNNDCVKNSSAVMSAQKKLFNVLLEPAENRINNFITLTILFFLGSLFFLLFIIYFLVGIIEFSPKKRNPKYNKNLNKNFNNQNINNQNINNPYNYNNIYSKPEYNYNLPIPSPPNI